MKIITITTVQGSNFLEIKIGEATPLSHVDRFVRVTMRRQDVNSIVSVLRERLRAVMHDG